LLGTGDVLSRYDYISTIYGTQRHSDPCIITTNNTIYWIDYDKHELLSYNGQLNLLSKSKYVQSYFNENPPSKSSAFAIYCPISNEVMFKNNSETGYIVYSETVDAFTSIHTIDSSSQGVFNYTYNTFTINKDKEFYSMHEYKDGEIESDFIIKLKYIVNENPTAVKVFDSQKYSGDVNVSSINFTTNSKTSIVISQDEISYREGTYMLSIPRENVDGFKPRMRGRYLTGNLEATGNFRLPYINTSYRMSVL
jgi:hypothetical protein